MAERSGSSYASSTEDRLPWLEPVEDDEADYVVPRGRLVGGVVAALVVIAVVVGGLFWLRQPHQQASSSGEVALITAPAGNYKTKPANAGGMKVAGEGATAYATSQGAEPNGTIDTSATPETPVKTPVKVAAAAPAKTPAAPAKPATPSKPTEVAIKTVPAKPAAKPSSTTVALPAAKPAATGGVSIQLGAFSSQAAADAAWKSLSGRFASSLGGLTKNVVAASKGSGTVYRLRASGAGAADVCGKLKVAGESCVVIRD